MINERWIEEIDFVTLTNSLAYDEFHEETKPDFFYQPGTVTKVYEDDQGPIIFVRGTKSLRIDVQFVDNKDIERNKQVMLEKFEVLAEQAKANGFTEIVFNTSYKPLELFCRRYLGFKKVDGQELRRFL